MNDTDVYISSHIMYVNVSGAVYIIYQSYILGFDEIS